MLLVLEFLWEVPRTVLVLALESLLEVLQTFLVLEFVYE